MKKLFLFLILAGLSCSAFAKTIVLYHTSDTHGFYYPKNNRGGFAALSALVQKEKYPYLLLDSGDFANGTIEAKNSKGLTSVRLMNAAGYQAVTVGNHEFDFGDEGLAPMFAEADFAVLAANLLEAETDTYPKNVRPYQIFDVDGVKIAVIGLANRTPTKPTKKYKFTKPLAALENALARAEKEGAAVAVVLVHDSYGDYQNGSLPYMGDIGKKFSGRVQVVLGGHAHKIFQNKRVGGVLYAESGKYAESVTRVSVELDDKTGKFKKAWSKLIPLDVKKTGSDKRVADLAESFRTPGVDAVLGHAKETLSNKSRGAEKDSPLDNWIADLGRASAGADLYIHNTGGTRTAMERGPVTKRDLIDIFPFDDTVVMREVSGRQLRAFIKNGLLPWNKYAYSGVKITYSRTRDGKVRNLKIWVNGKPLENNRMYRVATNSFIARQKIFADAPKLDAGNATVYGLIEEALKQGRVHAPDTGRIVQK